MTKVTPEIRPTEQLPRSVEDITPRRDPKGLRVRSGLRAGVTAPKLDGSSKDAAYFD